MRSDFSTPKKLARWNGSTLCHLPPLNRQRRMAGLYSASTNAQSRPSPSPGDSARAKPIRRAQGGRRFCERPPCKLLPPEKLAQFGDRVGEGASAWGLLRVAGGGLLIARYHLVPRLWCRDGLPRLLLLVRTVT